MSSPTNSSDYQLVVANAPILFLKQRFVKSHFSRFGRIASITINKSKRKIVVSFFKLEHAELAKRHGRQWKSFKLDISNVSTVTSLRAADTTTDLDGELNWYIEDDPLLFDNKEKEMFELRSSPKRSEDSNESQRKKINFLSDDFKEVAKKNLDKEAKMRVIDLEDNGEDLNAKVANTVNSRLALLEERDRQLRIRITRDSDIKTAATVKGICPDMCPEKERILREVRGIVANYESIDGSNTKMDHSRAVKDYARSSADQELPLAHELRPEPVLTMTLDYLITQIMTKIDIGEEDNLGNWYDFCWYRLRSIRKDIIQQQLCDRNIVEIVEKCARFHICCFDRLWGVSKSIFDDKINSETLMNCLQSLMHMYEDLRKQEVVCPNEAEFRAYLILLKLNSGFLLSEYQQYSSLLQNSSQVKDAVLIHTAYSNNMYSTYFNLMKKTSYLNCCLMQRFLAHLRTKALEIIVRAHCPPNKISRLPLTYVMQTLKFDTHHDCVNFCDSFGLEFLEDSYNFIVSRNDFFFPESLFVISTPSSLVVRKRVSVAKAVVGENSDLPIYIPHSVHSSFNDDGSLKQGALDATDQEEKLYRDIVERKLILKRGSLQVKQPDLFPQFTSMPTNILPNEELKVQLDDSSRVEPDLESINSGEEEDKESLDESSESEEFSDEEASQEIKESLSDKDSNASDSSDEVVNDDEVKETSFRNSTSDTKAIKAAQNSATPFFKFNFQSPTFIQKSSVNEPPKVFIPPLKQESPQEKSFLTPLNLLYSNLTSHSTPKSFPLELQQSHDENDFSPKLKSVDSSETPFKVPSTPIYLPTNLGVQHKTDHCAFKTLKNSEENLLSPKKRLKFEKMFPKSPSPVSPKSGFFFPKDKAGENFTLKKEKNTEEKLFSRKLKRVKPSEKIKKVSIHKYVLLWKNKVEKLKKTKDKSLREYLFYWGANNESSENSPETGFRKRLLEKKKTNLAVLSILYSNIVDKLDPAIGKIGKLVTDVLARVAINFAQTEGNIFLTYPVFWKLLFTLPPSLKGSFTFPDKLRNWCKAAFYSDANAKLGDVEFRLSSLGIPVFTCINVVIGNSLIVEKCTTASAAIVIRADGWESIEDTQQRCDKLILSSNNKFPMAVLTLGDKFESCRNLRYRDKLSYYCESMWNTTDELFNTILSLAEHTYIYNLKVESLGQIVMYMSEKLFDSLHQDRFINDNLYFVLCEPNNAILLYNELLNKIKAEIIDCYQANFYATACEFEPYLKQTYSNIVKFPNHYKDKNFCNILENHIKTFLLPNIKWPFTDSKDLLATFRNYCNSLRCDKILSKLMRIINPPDSDDKDRSLKEHLESIPWLRLVEDVVKEIITQDHFKFNVVYREKKMAEIINSHWWMYSDIVINS